MMIVVLDFFKLDDDANHDFVAMMQINIIQHENDEQLVEHADKWVANDGSSSFLLLLIRFATD